MEVGVVKVADDDDFSRLKELCLCHDDWRQDYCKNTTTVWTRANDASFFRMVKIKGVYADVSAAVVYDVLHDADYRGLWDPNLVSGHEICRINENNDIGYYAMHLPRPLTNRDFVTQRSWRDKGVEKFILNHSVNHAAMPPQKYFIRGISYITGYYIVSTVDNPNKPGCEMTYVTQSDPKGHLPVWVVNRSTQWLAPRVMDRLRKGCLKYNEWKSKNNPDYKPWLHPEQNTLPFLSQADILAMTTSNDSTEEEADEDGIGEEEMSMNSIDSS